MHGAGDDEAQTPAQASAIEPPSTESDDDIGDAINTDEDDGGDDIDTADTGLERLAA